MAEARKHYYIALLDTSTNEVRFVPNTIKGRNTIVQFKNDNTKAYKVGASKMEEAYEVFKKNTGFEPTLVNIKYSRNIPEVQEVEL